LGFDDEIDTLQLTDVVSQSDVLRFLHQHQHQLGRQLLDGTLSQVWYAGGWLVALPHAAESSLVHCSCPLRHSLTAARFSSAAAVICHGWDAHL
jgi:hypothetical protein